MSHSSVDRGRVIPTLLDSYLIPKRPRYRELLIYCHGVTGDATEMLGGAGVPSLRTFTRALVDHADGGWAMASISIPGTWGDVFGMSCIDAHITWMQTTFPDFVDPSKPVKIVGTSHGGSSGLTYGYTRTIDAMVGIIPAIDQQAIRVSNVMGLRASIDPAWGVTYPAALPAGANPNTTAHKAILKFINQQLWYSSDDTVSENIATYGAETYAELHNMGALGHTDTAVGTVDPDAVVEFLNRPPRALAA